MAKLTSPQYSPLERSVSSAGTKKTRWISLPFLIYAVSRVLDGLLLSWASRFQPSATVMTASNDPSAIRFTKTGGSVDLGYLGIATNWDGQWYELIATRGYQRPGTGTDGISERAWAFPPLYPKIAGWIMRISGWDFSFTAVVLSLACGAIAMVLLFRLVQPHVGDIGAAGLVAVTCMFVSAPLLQVAYSESMALALLASTLLMLRRGSYWWAILPLLLLALTRIVTPPLAFVAIAHWLYGRRRCDAKARTSDLVGLCVFATLAFGSALLWTVLTGTLRGTFEQDRAIQLGSHYTAGYFGAFAEVSTPAIALPLAMSGALVAVSWAYRHRWGAVLSAWAATYPIYILLVTPPTTGLLRYLLLAFPFGLLFVGTPSTPKKVRICRIFVACVCFFVLQVLWVWFSFVIVPDDNMPALMP